MAIIRPLYNTWDNSEWVVERSDGSSDGYREFNSYREAEEYKNYLQAIEDREKTISQNQRIIDELNQIKQQGRTRQYPSRPQAPQPARDPEYEDWLRFKKETDPKYKAWKAEDERKKREKLLATQRATEETRRAADSQYVKEQKRFIESIRIRLTECFKSFKTVAQLYSQVLCNPFSASRIVNYNAEENYETFKIYEGTHLDDYTGTIKSSYSYLEGKLKGISDINSLFDEISATRTRSSFENKRKAILELENQFSLFYGYFYKGIRNIVQEYNAFNSSDYVSRMPSTIRPQGFFAKQKVQSVIRDYLRDNEKKYKTIQSIYSSMDVIIKRCSILIH